MDQPTGIRSMRFVVMLPAPVNGRTSSTSRRLRRVAEKAPCVTSGFKYQINCRLTIRGAFECAVQATENQVSHGIIDSEARRAPLSQAILM